MEGKQPNSSEEIDLAYLFRPVTKLIGKLGNAIAWYITLLRNNALVFCAIIVLLTGMGFCLRYVIKPAFNTEGTFMSRLLPAKYCASLVENLNEHKKEPVLAEKLHISGSMAHDIRFLNVLPNKDSFRLDNRDSMGHVFTIQLVVDKMDNLDTIQQGLMGYFENNEYAVRQKDNRKKILLALRSDIETRLLSLDSLKTIVNNSVSPRSSGQGIILGQPIDPVNVYKTIASYYRDKLNLDEQLSNLNNMQVIQSFLPLTKYNYPNYNLMLFYAFAASLVTALLLTPLIGKKPRA